MNEWSVLSVLREIHAFEDSEAAELLPLCRHALEELCLKLKPGVSSQDIRVLRAAATDVNYLWTVRKLYDEDNIASFKAGDVTISRSASLSIETASSLRKEAYLAVLPLVKDEFFLFESI